jgi:uncharacterized protein (TIGR03437 family)
VPYGENSPHTPSTHADEYCVGKIILLSGVLVLASRAQTVTVTATPSSLTFTYQSGAATLPAAQTVSVKAGTLGYTTSISPNTDLWLTVSPDSGTLPGTVSVRVNPNSLSEGTYSATVVVTVASVVNPVNIPVTLNVTAPPSTLTLSPTTLSFVAPPLPVATQTVTLSTDGAPISYTATSGATWMTVSPAVGVALPGDPVTLTVTVDPTNLTPQTAPFAGKITVVASGAAVTTKSQNVTVSFAVSSTVPTIVSVWPSTLPLNGGAQSITIRGTNFFTGTVAEVQGIATPLTTTVLSPSALIAVVPAALLTTAGPLNVIVSNPLGGGPSTALVITVANTPTILGVVNAGSYGSAAVSPGELATIFGTNIGPAAPATMTIANGYVATSLGGVTVTVEGQAAPMVYASSTQVSFQVPYEASTTGAGQPLVVTNGNNPPASATVTVATTAPGIFTADGSGSGQAAALNYNADTQVYTLNGSTNPAKIGDTVLLYLTGEGDYNSTGPLSGVPGASNSGYIIPPSLASSLPQMNPLPTVTIGGASATVSYAGPMVGAMLGVLQMNVVIPAGSTTGASVPLVVTIGGIASQANVTLAIHP